MPLAAEVVDEMKVDTVDVESRVASRLRRGDNFQKPTRVDNLARMYPREELRAKLALQTCAEPLNR